MRMLIRLASASHKSWRARPVVSPGRTRQQHSTNHIIGQVIGHPAVDQMASL